MNKYAFWDIKWEDMEVLVDLSYNKTQKWLIVAIFRPKLDKIEGVPWQKKLILHTKSIKKFKHSFLYPILQNSHEKTVSIMLIVWW